MNKNILIVAILIILAIASIFLFDIIIFTFFFSFYLLYRRESIKIALIELFVIYFISFLFEFLGVNFGIPFGKYYYSNALGFKLFGVPFSVPFMWFSFVTLSFLIVKNSFLSPLLTVSIDLLMDPYMSNFGWFWQTKLFNFYYGIPLSNFIGWYVVSFILIQVLIRLSKSKIKSTEVFALFLYFLMLLIWLINDYFKGLYLAVAIGFILIIMFFITFKKEFRLLLNAVGVRSLTR
ncbi:MAG: carotenoid biosynthesis protein [Candidatus Parvarchaeota archaeon]|nr:carotenoid biosynthesis protein [Candidatus Rehaiarchaeum fermentans]